MGDLKIIVEQMEDFMIKHQTEHVDILGSQVISRKQSIQSATYAYIKSLQEKKTVAQNSTLQYLKSKQVSEFDKGGMISLLDTLQRVEYWVMIV